MKIRFFITVLFLIYAFFPCPGFSNETVTSAIKPIISDYIPGELLIKFKNNIRKSTSTNRYKNEITTIKSFKHTNCDHIRLPSNMSVQEALAMYGNDPDVLWVEPNYIRRQMAIDPPDDPFFADSQWGLNNTGQQIQNKTGSTGTDIDALDAWEINSDCSNIIIAVIDSGIDYNHPDLKDNLWTNPGETINGIDDDGNGYIDDLHGWNFSGAKGDYTGNNNIFDSNGHGTHVAGTMAAKGNNGTGITGVCWTARIMILKFLDDKGVGTSAEEIAAIEYAIDKGARIINASFGEEGYIQAERDAIDAAGKAGILFIAASGNNGHNNDTSFDYTNNDTLDSANYPASYSLPNIISVGASDQDDHMPSWSAYGLQSVDVTAPGSNIYGPSPDTAITIWEEDFESTEVISKWDLQDAWNRTSELRYDGDYSLSVDLGDIPNSETSAVSPINNIAGKAMTILNFHVRSNSETGSEKLFIETAPSVEGPWTNQLIELFQYGSINVFNTGISGNNLESLWTSARVCLILAENTTDIYIRFHMLVTSNTNVTSNKSTSFCFVETAWAADSYGGAWYIDNIMLQGVDTSYPNPENQYYEFLDGTSAAVPFVSGLAGLIWHRFPDLTADQVKTAILQGVDPIPSMSVTGGRINAYDSLVIAEGM